MIDFIMRYANRIDWIWYVYGTILGSMVTYSMMKEANDAIPR